jgi:hypothetical protein
LQKRIGSNQSRIGKLRSQKKWRGLNGEVVRTYIEEILELDTVSFRIHESFHEVGNVTQR